MYTAYTWTHCQVRPRTPVSAALRLHAITISYRTSHSSLGRYIAAGIPKAPRHRPAASSRGPLSYQRRSIRPVPYFRAVQKRLEYSSP